MKGFKRFFCILILLFNQVLFSQQNEVKKYELKWIDSKEFLITKNISIFTETIEGQVFNEHMLPVFSDSWKISAGVGLHSYSIKNVTYSTSKLNSKKNVYQNVGLIPTEIKAHFNVVKQRSTTLAVLQINPYINVGNEIKRIESFDLEYSFVENSNKLNTISTVKNSVLNSGSWYKFAIDTTGVFKIDKDFLEKLGINTTTINPKNIQIYGNGGAMLPTKNSDFRYDDLQENAIQVVGEDDNRFDSNDYVLFYGQGPHHWIKSSSPTITNLKHNFNIYSDLAYYFIHIGNNPGKRIVGEPLIEGVAGVSISNFYDYTFFEEDETNLYGAGQQWFGENLTLQNKKTITIPFNEIDNGSAVFVKVRGVVESGLSSIMNVKVNDQGLFSINFPGSGGLTKAIAADNFGQISASGTSVKVEVEFNNAGNPSAKAFLDFVEVIGKKKLLAKGNQFSFRNFDVASTSGIVEYNVDNSTNIEQVWKVTNSLNPTKINNKNSGGTKFSFNALGGIVDEFIVLPKNDFYKPILLKESKVENQNLHSLTNVDYLIVTADYLVNQAERLAEFHRLNSNLKVEVVKLNQIYNEFSSGSPDLTAIRDFVRHLYTNATTNKIKYVCLFGDASYDYKDRIGGNNNIVPVFEAFESFNLAASYVTDDYFGMMDDNEGDLNSFERQDVATGRIPVTDVNQAEKVVDKLLSYYNTNSFGNWRTNLTLIADDIDDVGEQVLQENMESIAGKITENRPEFNLKKIYLDAYKQETTSGGKKYPTVNLDILNQIDAGTLMVNYFGHGGEGGWASEVILDVPMIQSLKNSSKLPLFITVTCQFSRFDNPLRKTAGEFLFWNEKGGASTLISTTREIFISVGQSLNERLVEPLLSFNGENYTISEALMHTKNQFSTSQRFFIFNIGDPAMPVAAPKPNVKLLTMNGKDISQSLDTIKALSYVKFEGEVTNESNQLLNGFNGELNIIVYDKPIIKTTLDNDFKNQKMQFNVVESKLFTGRSKVENGKFTFDFIAPKDLKVAYGKGKLSFYASNASFDKIGFKNDIIIGGIDKNVPADVEGPKVQLYLNDLNFVSGSNTNASPLLIAVIEDESGINTSITAVDHDIVAIIDGDVSNPIVLNDFYQTELNDFKKGKLSYQLRDLSPGLHTITLKVWDTYNNISETSFSFIVVSDEDLVLSNVLNYPNPFINYTEFWFNHNKPNELLNVQVQIFTVSGKLIKTINETIQSEGNISKSINWNGLDDFGSKIGKGVYIYKLKVKAVFSNSTAEKIEKLVILQ